MEGHSPGDGLPNDAFSIRAARSQYRTARKASQLLWRFAYKLRKPRYRSITSVGMRNVSECWLQGIEKPASWLRNGCFRFLNQKHSFSPNKICWNDPSLKLWLYNLHYFDWLQAADARRDIRAQYALMRRWVSENPFGHGNGWEPYPLSLRIVNWVKFALNTSGSLPSDLANSLAAQVDALSSGMRSL